MNNITAEQVASATIKKMTERKPKWFTSHEKQDEKDFGDIKANLKTQDVTLAELKSSHIELVKMQKEYHELTVPVFEYMNEITVGRKIRADYLKMTGVWTGVILGISAVSGVIWGVFKFLVFNAK